MIVALKSCYILEESVERSKRSKMPIQVEEEKMSDPIVPGYKRGDTRGVKKGGARWHAFLILSTDFSLTGISEVPPCLGQRLSSRDKASSNIMNNRSLMKTEQFIILLREDLKVLHLSLIEGVIGNF